MLLNVMIIISDYKYKITNFLISSICKMMGLYECKREQDFTLYQKASYFVKLSGKSLCIFSV